MIQESFQSAGIENWFHEMNEQGLKVTHNLEGIILL